MTHRDGTRTPVLSGSPVTLRPFVAEDADAMAAILTGPEALRLTGSVSSAAEATASLSAADERLVSGCRSAHRDDQEGAPDPGSFRAGVSAP